ncbi:hypothetical protein DPMN_123255 [Dreissena polymorpha]|uniref:Zinc finger PHD-type domain-containing protein n=1 Tax=Dreissena polymorpha TaxID=45954 RepID=A0A9D4GQ04_DREPO|nr:hypothetical protein DPMN_123255 [Dreissena polymorpha]
MILLFTFCVGIDDEETPMIECEGQDCSNGKWFHFECVGMKEDTVPEGSWYCSAECRSKLSSYCYCKRQIQDQPMVECCHSLCANGRWFHAKCIGLTEDTLPGEGIVCVLKRFKRHIEVIYLYKD